MGAVCASVAGGGTHSGVLSNSISRSKRNVNKYTDVELIVFYRNVKKTFQDYLLALSPNNEQLLLFFESIDELRQALEMKSSRPQVIIDSWKNTFLADKFLHTIKLSEKSLAFIKTLKSGSALTKNLAKQIGMLRGEIMELLSNYVPNFLQHETFLNQIANIQSQHKNIKRKRILFVAENLIFVKIVTKLLQELQYEVNAVTAGTAVIPELMSSVYNIVMMSYDLKAIKVLQDFLRVEEMCRSKVENYSRPVMVCLLSRDVKALHDGALAAGFTGTLPIPFTANQFEKLFPSKSMSRQLSRRLASMRSVSSSKIDNKVYCDDDDDDDDEEIGMNAQT